MVKFPSHGHELSFDKGVTSLGKWCDGQDPSVSLMIRLQRIYNLWSIHAMFTIFLYDFGMIWLELTWTDAVFSRTTVVLFLCRNKSSRNAMKINGDFFWKIWKILEKKSTGGESRGPHEGRGRTHPPRARPPASWTPWGPPLTWNQHQLLL